MCYLVINRLKNLRALSFPIYRNLQLASTRGSVGLRLLRPYYKRNWCHKFFISKSPIAFNKFCNGLDLDSNIHCLKNNLKNYFVNMSTQSPLWTDYLEI